MEESTKSAIIKSIVLCLLGAVFIGGIFLVIVRNKKPKTGDDYVLTVVDGITTTDLDKKYPSDGIQVVELYTKILQVLYKETYTDRQEDDMLKVMKGLMDEDFLAQNANFEGVMKLDVKQKRDEDYSIPLYTVITRDPVIRELDGKKTQMIECKILLRHGTVGDNFIYQFILRKDDEGKWKIFGWAVKPKEE